MAAPGPMSQKNSLYALSSSCPADRARLQNYGSLSLSVTTPGTGQRRQHECSHCRDRAETAQMQLFGALETLFRFLPKARKAGTRARLWSAIATLREIVVRASATWVACLCRRAKPAARSLTGFQTAPRQPTKDSRAVDCQWARNPQASSLIGGRDASRRSQSGGQPGCRQSPARRR